MSQQVAARLGGFSVQGFPRRCRAALKYGGVAVASGVRAAALRGDEPVVQLSK